MLAETLEKEKTLMLEGALDAQVIGPIQNKFQGAIDASKQNIILDMSAVNFMDSSGVGSIVFLYKRLMADNRTLTLVGLSGQPKKIIEFLRIDKIIKVVQE